MPKQNEAYAYFKLIGDFDPEDITHIIGRPASKSWKSGDAGTYNPSLPCCGWHLTSALAHTEPLEAHIVDVLDQMDRFEAGFLDITCRFESIMQLVGYHHKYDPGLHLTAKLIRRLSNYKLAVDCDFYHHSSPYSSRAPKLRFRTRPRPSSPLRLP